MVQKKVLDWQMTDVLSTPSQKRLYIEGCKDWLLSISDDTADETEVRRQDAPILVEPQLSDNIGIAKEHININNNFSCFLCDTFSQAKDGHIVNANPFARAQCLLVCTKCCI